MSNANRRRGFGFEREFANFWKNLKGFSAKRAWGSNGEAIGMHKEVDVAVWPDPDADPIRFQCKRHKRMPKWLQMPDEVDAVAFREDRGDTYILVRLSTFAELL